MDYIGINCPVCGKAFTDSEDIVVCPKCGTPHHRECYEKDNICVNYNKHNEGFIFESEKFEDVDKNEKDASTVLCPRCNAINPQNMFYCGKCGFPLNLKNNSNKNNEESPFHINNIVIDPFDPMAGMDPETDMGDDVTAGDIAKYVQNNTSYFLRVFSSIKNLSRGRFSFVGFLFSGGYLLYRKMYKKGIILTVFMAVLLILEVLVQLTPQFKELTIALSEISKNAPSIYSYEYMTYMIGAVKELDITSMLMLIFVYISAGLQIAIKIIVGINANKWYFKHCKKKIADIKKNTTGDINSLLEIKGGVNKGLATSLLIAYLILSYVPMLFQM